LGRHYLALQAFLPQTENNIKILNDLQNYLSKKYNVAVTAGFGPRFLHSTGQLHKGDFGNGIFLQFADKPALNVPIPDEVKSDKSGITFDVLIQAQGLGDRAALIKKGRKILRLELKGNLADTINELKTLLE